MHSDSTIASKIKLLLSCSMPVLLRQQMSSMNLPYMQSSQFAWALCCLFYRYAALPSAVPLSIYYCTCYVAAAVSRSLSCTILDLSLEPFGSCPWLLLLKQPKSNLVLLLVSWTRSTSNGFISTCYLGCVFPFILM